MAAPSRPPDDERLFEPAGFVKTAGPILVIVGLILVIAVLMGLVAVLFAFPGRAAAQDFDCADFSTQAQAQQYLLPGDPYRLDADHDGVACESLPCPCSTSAGSGGGG